ncbi:2791_t:CDS:2, partial [Cetraspora pellucida]
AVLFLAAVAVAKPAPHEKRVAAPANGMQISSFLLLAETL